jgi:crotonobetainyl-CoA:carnitine CoA-transferase CaiB-like acyl-CoA transferase
MCNKQKFWPILAERIGRPDLAIDPRFATFQDRLANREALTAVLDDVLAAATTDAWLAAFAGTVPAAPVYDVGQALSSQFVTETGRVAQFARAEGGAPVTMLSGAIRVDGAATPCRAAPVLGADTATVLGRVGVGADALTDLRARKVV